MKERRLESRLKSALHEHFDAVLREPMPKRIVDLIHELNERERQEAQVRQRAKKSDPP
jgi:hypothetical protein